MSSPTSSWNGWPPTRRGGEGATPQAWSPARRRSRAYILTAWGLVAVACTLASVLGYTLLAGLSPILTSAMLALAAGGILAMLADTMMPEAFQNGGPLVALATAVGFACAFLLSHLAG